MEPLSIDEILDETNQLDITPRQQHWLVTEVSLYSASDRIAQMLTTGTDKNNDTIEEHYNCSGQCYVIDHFW